MKFIEIDNKLINLATVDRVDHAGDSLYIWFNRMSIEVNDPEGIIHKRIKLKVLGYDAVRRGK